MFRDREVWVPSKVKNLHLASFLFLKYEKGNSFSLQSYHISCSSKVSALSFGIHKL